MADEQTGIPKYHSRMLDIVQGWLPVLTVVAGGLWACTRTLTVRKLLKSFAIRSFRLLRSSVAFKSSVM